MSMPIRSFCHPIIMMGTYDNLGPSMLHCNALVPCENADMAGLRTQITCWTGRSGPLTESSCSQAYCVHARHAEQYTPPSRSIAALQETIFAKWLLLAGVDRRCPQTRETLSRVPPKERLASISGPLHQATTLMQCHCCAAGRAASRPCCLWRGSWPPHHHPPGHSGTQTGAWPAGHHRPQPSSGHPG